MKVPFSEDRSQLLDCRQRPGITFQFGAFGLECLDIGFESYDMISQH